jgi:hypothetical protein
MGEARVVFLVRDFLNLLIVTNDQRERQIRASIELYARFAEPPVTVEEVLNLPLDAWLAKLPEIVKRVGTAVGPAADLAKLLH